MLQLDNQSRYQAAIAALPDRHGVDTLYVVVRGTYTIAPVVRLADEQLAPTLADEHWGDPATSSLKYASELHLGKTGTDVVVVGSAHAPDGRPVQEMVAAVEVAGVRKIAHVVGDRTWRPGGVPSGPEPFLTMPLVWERAFGGTDRSGDTPGNVLADDRNPVGRGFPGRRKWSDVVGEELPNVEDPRAPLESFGQVRDPVGFGFVAPSWLPRRAYAGTYDAAWVRRRAPYMPDDFDPRFFSAASEGLALGRFLGGGEPVSLWGMHPSGFTTFELPRAKPAVAVRLAGKVEAAPVRLETVVIEPDLARLSLTFRAQVSCDKRTLKVETVTITEHREASA